MIVEIKHDIFVSSDFKTLNFLIQILTYKQRYEMFVEWTLINGTEYYSKLDFDDRKEIEENYNRIINDSKSPNYFITNANSNEIEFNLEEAVRFFIQPVSIILENSLNDQYFLKAIIKHFDETGKVQSHFDNGWIQFENAGGCSNVENFVNGKLQSFNSLGKDNHHYLRCLVILDSDKGYPDARLKQLYEGLSTYLITNQISFHLLQKRSMENYLPSEVYSYISDTPILNTWTAAYNYLNNEQKDFLNINAGFSKKNETGISIVSRIQLDSEVQNLYANISKQNYDILDSGFRIPNFKTSFPEYFKHHQVHKITLQSRCGSDELQVIINKIMKLL
jgi:hypothetical protein